MATATSKNKPLYTERATQKKELSNMALFHCHFGAAVLRFLRAKSSYIFFFRKWKIIIHVNAASHCELYGIAAAKKAYTHKHRDDERKKSNDYI